ncbi:MAG: hypothetical protein NFCOHLIN_02784 [Gammaproteobacteria bacterium]|nr:hypothetical protein [Gammaproteobacteria bacterium]
MGLRPQGADLRARGIQRRPHLLEIARQRHALTLGAQHLVLRAQALVVGLQASVLSLHGFERLPDLLTRGKRGFQIGAGLVGGVLVVVYPVAPGVELRLQARRALRHAAAPVPPIDEPFGQPSDNEPHDQPGHRTHLELHLPHNSSWEPLSCSDRRAARPCRRRCLTAARPGIDPRAGPDVGAGILPSPGHFLKETGYYTAVLNFSGMSCRCRRHPRRSTPRNAPSH